jgi:molecular chaperone GrpE
VTQSNDHEVSDPRGKQTEGRGAPFVSDEPQVTAGPQAPEEAVDEAPVETPEPDPLADVTRERDEYLDALQRLKAEFDNYRKRAAREQSAIVTRASERLVKELIPVLDDLERALDAAEEHEEAKLEEGVRLVQRALADALQREGLAEIETNGRFDPHIHEALLSQPDDEVESGAVLQVLQKGYRLGDKVIRPARVIVAE